MSKSNGMYYTPKEIIDPAAGTGNYLNVAADLLSNPPYAAQHRMHLTAFGVGGLCFAAGIVVGCLLYAC